MTTHRRPTATTDHERELLTFMHNFRDLRRSMPGVDRLTYAGIEDFVLRHGSFHTPTPLPSTVRRGVMRACYYNAYRLARTSTRLRFVEGFALGIIPVAHAWCINARGEVVDPTWEAGLAYFGVEVNLATVRRMVRAHESYSVLQSDWMRHTCGPCILLGDVDRVIASHPFTTTPTADAPTGGA